MLEEMARAAYEKLLEVGKVRHPEAAVDAWLTWDEMRETDRLSLVLSQAAALLVLREPTERMKATMTLAYYRTDNPNAFDGMQLAFQAVIDAVLAEKETP